MDNIAPMSYGYHNIQFLLDWCAEVEMRVHVLLTKADKLSRGKGHAVLQKVRQTLANSNPDCTVQLFSALDGTGVEQARSLSLSWLNREIVASAPRADSAANPAADADAPNSNGNEN